MISDEAVFLINRIVCCLTFHYNIPFLQGPGVYLRLSWENLGCHDPVEECLALMLLAVSYLKGLKRELNTSGTGLCIIQGVFLPLT